MDTVRCAFFRRWVAVLLLTVFSVPSLAAPKVAMVIGNASYAHAPVLANPLNDAADIGAALERLGFSVTRIVNAGQAELRRGLQEFALAASASEVAVVFYAGHGIEVDRRNFLIPVDARLSSDQDVEFEAVPLELVARAVERASGLRLMILDACRDNPFLANMQRAGATRSMGRGLARVEPSGETLVAYAAKEGTVASDGTGRNSPYSEALLAHLEKSGLEVGLMFRKVRDTVLASTGGRQEPFVYGSLSSQGVYLAGAPSPTHSLVPATRPDTPNQSASARVTAEQLATEREFWVSVKGSSEPADIQAYLDRYPHGAYAVLARSRLRRLEDTAKPSTSPVSEVPATPKQVPSSIAYRIPEPTTPARKSREQAQRPEEEAPAAATLAALPAADQAWIRSSCPRVLGPASWARCVQRQVRAITAGMPNISELTAADQAWIRSSCPRVLGPASWARCGQRQVRAITAGMPDISELTAANQAWIRSSCPRVLGPASWARCVQRQAQTFRATQ